MRHIADWSITEWLCTAAGPATIAGIRFASRRPPLSGVYVHILSAVAGYWVGRGIHELMEQRMRTRRLYVEDYVRLHPEDFIEEKKKYKDVLLPWNPARR